MNKAPAERLKERLSNLPNANLIEKINIDNTHIYILGIDMADDEIFLFDRNILLDHHIFDALFDKYATSSALKKTILIGAIDNNLSTWALNKLEDDETLYNELFAQIFAAGL